MPIENPTYDVALSFLSSDEKTAAALYRKLSEGLKVFFYPHKQDELAGTDGLESMRTPFLSESRVMVVIYRERWGKTPWTRVEEAAIKDACLAHGWRRLFFLVMDRSSALPVWLPDTHVSFSYDEYGPEQAVGAIKARVQENGGECEPLTALKRAEMYKQDRLYQFDKERMSSSEGQQAIHDKIAELFQNIQAQCTEIDPEGHLQVRCGAAINPRNALQECIVTNSIVGLSVAWTQTYSNVLGDSALTVAEFNSGLITPEDRGRRMYTMPPQRICETKCLPDLSLAREYGWKEDGTNQFLSSAELAERCVIQFLDLADRRARGELKARPW